MATEEDFRLWEEQLAEVDEGEIAELYDATRDMLGGIDPEEAARTLDGLGRFQAARNARANPMTLTVEELFVVALAQNKLIALFILAEDSDEWGAALIQSAMQMGMQAEQARR